MNNPLISIILPTYNVEKYIARALESCINQTFKDIEIIVVDDLGNDKSIDIAKEYASKDDRIKIIHNEQNLKLLRARYEGVKVATSPYIMFLDPDDYLELNACEECVKILNKNNKIDLIFFDAFVLSNNSKIERKLNFQEKSYIKKDFLKKLLKTKNLFWTMWGKVIKKELYLKAFSLIPLEKNTKINMAEDVLLYYPLINISNAIFYLNKNLYNYQISNSSITGTLTSLNIKTNIQEQDNVTNLLKKIQHNYNFNLALLFLINYFLLIEKYVLSGKKNSLYFKINIFFKKNQFKFYRFLKM
ncbi:glycosyltransferase family 2 protein [Campylobacter lari]|uniref:glycosyltransferase family 2 protein n=1 Tax=Campylobacter sp. IFREMER_LSEM_CL908 TaxID=2911624 RepID=UPI00127A63BD|nr:glycosyltransferase family 2 protein [Campylobacter sp. IFREMER_LSEM_CL908]EAK0817867.1 glycosyltransferase family 2 protein [Campylobacter lari]EAK9890889.1 glycosyltransferase family 2 protein [Campylobacter lari]EGK8026214.1 glycosyltransferase family 2 protein [Campylobacter lari]EID4797169.1 glycosyltransferase family 2 protein [Campylobacter lari]MCV3393246.1 glycosyltransferase family 2 protein [Campylobacter sp. IFREMER_LSEM_CL908]